ncbi:hypothetical protein ACMFMG_002899 [Clarireedia jacksonii]
MPSNFLGSRKKGQEKKHKTGDSASTPLMQPESPESLRSASIAERSASISSRNDGNAQQPRPSVRTIKMRRDSSNSRSDSEPDPKNPTKLSKSTKLMLQRLEDLLKILSKNALEEGHSDDYSAFNKQLKVVQHHLENDLFGKDSAKYDGNLKKWVEANGLNDTEKEAYKSYRRAFERFEERKKTAK